MKNVGTIIVNKIKSGYGNIYFEKYLRSKQLEFQGYETGNASSLMRLQILCDKYFRLDD